MEMPITCERIHALLAQIDYELYSDSLNLNRDKQDRLRTLLQNFSTRLDETYAERASDAR